MALTEHPIDLTPPRDPICPGVSFTVHPPWVRTVVMSAVMAVNLEAQYQLEIEEPGVAYLQLQCFVRPWTCCRDWGSFPRLLPSWD